MFCEGRSPEGQNRAGRGRASEEVRLTVGRAQKDEMRCKLDSMRIRVRSRNTQPHLKYFAMIVLSWVRLIRVSLLLVNLDLINDTLGRFHLMFPEI